MFICFDRIEDFIYDYPTITTFKGFNPDEIHECNEHHSTATKQQIFISEQFKKAIIFLRSVSVSMAAKGGKTGVINKIFFPVPLSL